MIPRSVVEQNNEVISAVLNGSMFRIYPVFLADPLLFGIQHTRLTHSDIPVCSNSMPR